MRYPVELYLALDITRGKEEHGWNNNMLPTSVSISLSIKDLTPAMFLGMSDIGLFDTFTRNETMHEYLDTLSALGISERKFLLPQMIRKASALLIKRIQYLAVLTGVVVLVEPGLLRLLRM